MKALVVYESMWGNTRKVAEAIGQGLGGAPVTEVGQVDQVTDRLGDVDLLVVGGPTHAFSMSRQTTRHAAQDQGATEGSEGRGIRDWLDDLPGRLDVPVATFDTRAEGVRHLPGSAAKAAGRELKGHHHARLVGRESFYVSDTSGPLLEGETERARDWGARLARLVEPV